MDDIATTSVHAYTTRLDIHEIARQLVAHLGPTAVSYLAGAKSSRLASRWSKADGPEPRQAAQQKLMAAHRAWQEISTSDNDYVARNWFIGANPRLEERAPIEVLRDGDIAAFLGAAKAFWEGTDG